MTRERGEPTIPVPFARGVAFVLLAGFAGLHWMVLISPHAPGRAGSALLVAIGAMLALLAAGRLHGRAARQGTAVAIAVAALVGAMLAGGVPGWMLRPARWGELAAGISRGLGALPGVTVPYEGVDDWLRIVIPLGGTVLIVAAALAAFWPRRDRLGRPVLALVLLVVLYVVPAVSIVFSARFVGGAALAVLMLAFLRLEKLRLPDVRLAGAFAVAAALLALVVGPALNGGGPWFDYESWAASAASSKTTTYSWNHTYGPLSWPRDGREMLRVKAPHPAYWKAENLDFFDGRAWVDADAHVPAPLDEESDPTLRREWTETIHVTVDDLRTTPVIGGGYTLAVHAPGVPVSTRGDGTYLAGRTLGRGDSYTATIYAPQPTERELHAAPPTDSEPVFPYLGLLLPKASNGSAPAHDVYVEFPRYGTLGTPEPTVTGPDDARTALGDVLHSGPYARVWRLAQRLKRGTHDEEGYVQRVMALLGHGYAYSETPPPAAQTLPGFLFDAKLGYCQQFSGAMALLLRMGGVPAHVSTGFTSGLIDHRTGEYVVRDLDAHSWVEAWFPAIGWVTFDPTPAIAPARAEAGAGGATTVASDPKAPELPGDKGFTRAQLAAHSNHGMPWWQVVLLVLAGIAAAAVGGWAVWRIRRPATPALVELERALHRMHRAAGPATTLRALEGAFARSPAAAGYVRTLREARYGGRPAAPTRTQRRALRSELARGGSRGDRMRAWWALPPL